MEKVASKDELSETVEEGAAEFSQKGIKAEMK